MYCMCVFIVQGNIALEKSKRVKPYAWLPDEGWEDCNHLVGVEAETFGTLLDDVERNEKIWKAVIKFDGNWHLKPCSPNQTENYRMFLMRETVLLQLRTSRFYTQNIDDTIERSLS